MNGPAANALTVLLFGLAGLLLIGLAGRWAKLGKDRDRPNEAPAIPVHGFRAAASLTAVAFGFLGIALVWFAMTQVSWGD